MLIIRFFFTTLCSSKMVSVVLGPSASWSQKESSAVESELELEQKQHNQQQQQINERSNLDEDDYCDCDYSTHLSLAALELVNPPIVQLLQAAWSQ